MTIKEEIKFYKKTIRRLRLCQLPIIGKLFIKYYCLYDYELYLAINNTSIYRLPNLFKTIPAYYKLDWFKKQPINVQIIYLKKSII